MRECLLCGESHNNYDDPYTKAVSICSSCERVLNNNDTHIDPAKREAFRTALAAFLEKWEPRNMVVVFGPHIYGPYDLAEASDVEREIVTPADFQVPRIAHLLWREP